MATHVPTLARTGSISFRHCSDTYQKKATSVKLRHPYGTGSLYSEPGSGGMYRLIRNRLLAVQSCFRSNNLYAFWALNRVICKELFLMEKYKKGRKGAADSEESKDPITRLYGTAVPSAIPESTAWPRP